jgi:hypothetical protein
MTDPYSQNYRQARSRFRAAAKNIDAELEVYPVQGSSDNEESLTIDVARLGAAHPTWSVVVSCALHGVEGFMGSAIQIACLEQLRLPELARSGGELVFIHAINPFGFSELRRGNEQNIDLNRNFLLPGEAYAGASAEYAALNDLLNPRSPPQPLDPYLIKIGWSIARMGMPKLKQAVAGGQYEYPQGLFFGGHGAARSTEIIKDNIMRWIKASRVVHLDFHSGLGKYGKYVLLAPPKLADDELNRYRRLFGADIKRADMQDGIAYETRGDLGRYVTASAGEVDYRFLFVEFGTYPAARVLGALRNENRAHFFTPAGSDARRRAKAALIECFCPSSPAWRTPVVRQGLQLIEMAQLGAPRG